MNSIQRKPSEFHDWLVVTQYFHPETGAPQIRLRALVKELTRLGHRVTVLTGMPNYPEGVIHEGYRGKFSLNDEIDGIKIKRIWLYPAGGKKVFQRLMNYLSFTFHALFYLGLARDKQIIFIEAQPLSLALYGLLARWFLKVPYIYNTPDLQVEIAGERAWVGRSFVKLATMIETFLMEHAYSVATVTPAFIEHFVSVRGIPREQLSFLPNGVDLEQLHPLPYDAQCAEQMGVTGKKVLTYAGTHADYQGLDLILDAAKRLKDRSDIVFLMVGKGPERQRLIDRARIEGISNVLFKDSPFEERSSLMSVTYAFIAVLRNIPVAQKMRLSKIFPPLACGVPVIYAGVGESAEIILNNDCGIVVPPEDPASLADAVRRLVDAPGRRDAFSVAGRKLVEREFSWNTIVPNWLRQLKRSGVVAEGNLSVDDGGGKSTPSGVSKNGGG
ncbi:glycosyltransferase family 4 protein [Nitrospira sp. BLG_1]|uniref:glycosyltransferase family 4 protein n=1 Tax=Nitrospira sp. BLG_1 TaxID=3395883 RepID=UPI0039BC446B